MFTGETKARPARQAPPANGGGLYLGRDLFLIKISRWLPLNELEISAFGSIPRSARTFSAGDTLETFNSARIDPLVMISGMAAAQTILPNGRRHISNVFMAGDLANFNSYTVGFPVSDIVALSDGSIASYDEIQFSNYMRAHPSISQAILLSETARTLFVSDRFSSASRSDGRERVLRLLLELKACSELVQHEPYDQLTLSLTQEQLADLIGITPVYVSRVLSRLEKEGEISRSTDRQVWFRDRAATELSVGFINRYQQIKTWRRPSRR